MGWYWHAGRSGVKNRVILAHFGFCGRCATDLVTWSLDTFYVFHEIEILFLEHTLILKILHSSTTKCILIYVDPEYLASQLTKPNLPT